MEIPDFGLHRADFIVWEEPENKTPIGMATTKRGEELYGHGIRDLNDVDPRKFLAELPDDVIVGIYTEDRGLQYASKNRLQ